MDRIIWAPTALRDVDDVWDYIARDSEARARDFVRRIDEIVALIAGNPEMGRRRGDLAERLRSFPVGNYLILYRPLAQHKGVEVARVLHAKRDIASLFLG